MNVVVIIPARFGSTRFQAKPLMEISGKPMIQHVYERAALAPTASSVVVATDDRRIFNVVEQFGGTALMTSDKNRSGTDRVGEAAELLKMEMEDIVVNVQGDQPLLHPKCIEDLVHPFAVDHQVKMTTLAYKIRDESEITNPKDVKVTFNKRRDALYFSRSPIPCGRDDGQKFDVFKHLGLYAYTRRFLERFRAMPSGPLEQIEKLEQLRALEHGFAIRVVVTEFDSPEVDIPEDVKRIERRLYEGSI